MVKNTEVTPYTDGANQSLQESEKKTFQFQLRSKSFEARHLPTRNSWLVNTALNIPEPCVRMFTKMCFPRTMVPPMPKNPQAETRLRFPMREVAVADRLRHFLRCTKLGGPAYPAW
jgi:hypothetical protein